VGYVAWPTFILLGPPIYLWNRQS